MKPLSLRDLNRRTLARQLLLERAQLDAETAIERLAGMQAQYTPSPYIGLWSRLCAFERGDLEVAFTERRVIKATLMRGTLHVVSARDFPFFRAGVPSALEAYPQSVKVLAEMGLDVEAIRRDFRETAAGGPRPKTDFGAVLARHLPADSLAGFGMTMISGLELVHAGETARFGFFGTPYLQAAPAPGEITTDEARAYVARAYLAAYGPATRADLSAWSGFTASAYAAALEKVGVVELKGEDGRVYLDIPGAAEVPGDTPAPVRFLSKWDQLLLAHARRERVLPEALRSTVIRKNGDVLPTFLVDGVVAGWWDAPLKKAATLTLRPLVPLAARQRRAVAAEAEGLLGWLRPDAGTREVRWTS